MNMRFFLNLGRSTTLILVVVPVLLSSCEPATSISDRSSEFFLTNVGVVNGLGDSLQSSMFVHVKDGVIADMGDMATSSIPSSASRIDATGRFLIPGFVDLHVHFPEDTVIQVAILSQLVDYGITTVLNPGARPGAGVKLRQKIETTNLTAPRMLTSGPIIDSPPVDEGLQSWSAVVTSRAEMIIEVRRQIETGVDFIKLYRHVPDSLVEVAIFEANAHGTRVVGHMGETNWATAASYGISMLVHSGWGTPMDELVFLSDAENATDYEWYHAYARATEFEDFHEFTSTLITADVTVVPTLSIHQAAGLGRDATLLPLFETHLAPDAYATDWWTEGWETRHPQFGADSPEEEELLMTVHFPGILSIIRGYYTDGVSIGVGTDVGNSWMTPGAVYHHELELYQDAGINPADIIRMATYNGARALGLEYVTGSIEMGKQADLILLSENPLSDIRNSRSIEAVYKNGVLVSHQ